MTLDSAQARIIAAQPRITPEERDQLISLLAEGKKPAELAVQFNKAAGTIANFQTRNKGEINEQRRKRTVQFEDLFIVRKQARLDDYQDLRNIAMGQIRALLASCFVIDGQTGQPEFAADLVDHRKLKIYSDMVFKADKLAAEETGQLPQRVDGLDQRWTPKVLGVNGKGGVDYAGLTQAAREWEAGAPQREAERARQEAVREEWVDESVIRSLVREGTSRKLAEDIVQSERDRKNGLSPEEVKQGSRERWEAADYAEALADLEKICEDMVTMNDDRSPLRLDAAGLEEARAYLKERGFPGDEAAHVCIDAFFDSWEYPEDPPALKTEEPEVNLIRVMPAPPEPEPEPVEVAEPVEEPVEEPEQPEEPEVPPVAHDVAEAAMALAMRIWSTGSMSRARLYERVQAHWVDQYLSHAQNMSWVVVDDQDRIVKGTKDPRQVTATRIPNF